MGRTQGPSEGLRLLLKSTLPQQLTFPISLHLVCKAHVLPVPRMGLSVGTQPLSKQTLESYSKLL